MILTILNYGAGEKELAHSTLLVRMPSALTLEKLLAVSQITNYMSMYSMN